MALKLKANQSGFRWVRFNIYKTALRILDVGALLLAKCFSILVKAVLINTFKWFFWILDFTVSTVLLWVVSQLQNKNIDAYLYENGFLPSYPIFTLKPAFLPVRVFGGIRFRTNNKIKRAGNFSQANELLQQYFI